MFICKYLVLWLADIQWNHYDDTYIANRLKTPIESCAYLLPNLPASDIDKKMNIQSICIFLIDLLLRFDTSWCSRELSNAICISTKIASNNDQRLDRRPSCDTLLLAAINHIHVCIS